MAPELVGVPSIVLADGPAVVSVNETSMVVVLMVLMGEACELIELVLIFHCPIAVKVYILDLEIVLCSASDVLRDLKRRHGRFLQEDCLLFHFIKFYHG